MIELSLGQKIILRIQGHVNVGMKMNISHYAFKCKEHGLVVGHAKRYSSQDIRCPKCLGSTPTRTDEI